MSLDLRYITTCFFSYEAYDCNENPDICSIMGPLTVQRKAPFGLLS